MLVRPAKLALALLVLAAAALPASAANRTGAVYHGPPKADPLIEGGANGCPPTGATVSALPFSDPGTTCDNTNTITNYGGVCGTDLPFPYGGENAIYQMTLAAGNNVAFSMSLTGSTGDLALFMITTCGNGTTCVAHSQDAVGAGNGPETIAAASYTAGTYFIYVDSYYDAGTTGSCGTYTLGITGTLPVELTDFSVE
jgi:hypothetical protein